MKIKGLKNVCSESKRYLRSGHLKMLLYLCEIDGELHIISKLTSYAGPEQPTTRDILVGCIERPHTMKELKEMCIAAIHERNARMEGFI